MPWYSTIPKQQVEHDSMGDWDWKATAEREWKRAEEAEIKIAEFEKLRAEAVSAVKALNNIKDMLG